jgi:hypothetical protein
MSRDEEALTEADLSAISASNGTGRVYPAWPLLNFKTGALNHSATLPEPGMAVA